MLELNFGLPEGQKTGLRHEMLKFFVNLFECQFQIILRMLKDVTIVKTVSGNKNFVIRKLYQSKIVSTAGAPHSNDSET